MASTMSAVQESTMENCGHRGAWFHIDIREDATERLCCFDCVTEEIDALPLGWAMDVERVERDR